jgi:hypothetical protein
MSGQSNDILRLRTELVRTQRAYLVSQQQLISLQLARVQQEEERIEADTIQESKNEVK